jgi:hypothetical protein
LSENDVNKARVVTEGALGWLIPLMRTPSVVVLEQMLMLMWNISINPDNKLHLVEKGVLPPLIGLIRSPEERIQELASGLDAYDKLKIANVYPAGLQLTVSVGNVLVWGTIPTDQTPPDPNWQNIPT